MFKKFIFRDEFPQNTKIIVFNEEGESLLQKTILKGKKYFLISKRIKIIYINFKLFVNFILNLKNFDLIWILKCKCNFKFILEQLYLIYLISLLKTLKPKVLITFIDNDWHFQYLSKVCKNLEFIAIQNGVRSQVNLQYDLPSYPHPANKIYHRNFFCFGKHEINEYKKYEHKVENFFAVGSLRLSWFLENKDKKNYYYKIKPNLVLISQWDQSIMLNGKYPEFKYGMEKLDIYLNYFLKKNKYKVNIILRSNSKCEHKYFKSIYDERAIFLIKNNETSSYHYVKQAKLSITIDSTLGREAYAIGRKVFFVNFTKFQMYNTPVDKRSLLNEENYSLFEKKIKFLLSEKQTNFYKRTSTNRSKIMKIGKTKKTLTHNIIKNHIDRILETN